MTGVIASVRLWSLLSSSSLVQNFIGCAIYFDHIYAKGVAFEVDGYRSAGCNVYALHQYAIDGVEVSIGVILKAGEGEEPFVIGDWGLVIGDDRSFAV